MTIQDLRWETVTVTYDQPVDTYDSGGRPRKKESDIYKKSSVSFDHEQSSALSILDGAGNGTLLAKAKLLSIDPWKMEWEAYYWSAKCGEHGFEQFIRATVVCEF